MSDRALPSTKTRAARRRPTCFESGRVKYFQSATRARSLFRYCRDGLFSEALVRFGSTLAQFLLQ